MNCKEVKRRDPLTPKERSERMSRVRNRGNRSTELCVAACLMRAGLRGWKRHPADVPGRPDFLFPAKKIAIFVDGCFWHGCRKCRRNVPHSRRTFWLDKIASNRRRDHEVTRVLKVKGYAVVRIWEHALANREWLSELRSLLS